MHHQARQVGLLALLLASVLWAAPDGLRLQPIDESGFARLVRSGKGRVVLYTFWATWCAPCREEMPALVKLDAKLRSRGFRLVTISADEPEQESDARRFLEQNGVAPPAFIKRAKRDEDFINSIDRKWVGALPASFLYDRQGNRVRSFIGEVSLADLEAAIRKLL